ncbi:unnamed protein product, partial [marine sediment metagenome]
MSWKGQMLRAGIDTDGKNFDVFNGNLTANNVAAPFGGDLYVNPARSYDGAGTSWTDAMNDLQTALDAVEEGGRIFCAPGGYTGTYATPLNAVTPRVSLIGH